MISQLELDKKWVSKLLALLEKGEVHVPDFGKFQIVEIPTKHMYHNFSGKQRKVKGYKRIKFSQSKIIKSNINI